MEIHCTSGERRGRWLVGACLKKKTAPVAAAAVALGLLLLCPAPARAAGEASLVIPDLNSAHFIGGVGGRTLLSWGLLICGLGLVFGLLMYRHLKHLPVHRSMREVSETIYETCKTYLRTQGKFILIL